MTANYLHGVETVEVDIGPRPVRLVKSAIIGLVGTAPILDVTAANRKVNRPVYVLGDQQAGRLMGTKRAGYTIPQALDRIFSQGKGTAVLVINVCDPDVHFDSVVDESITLSPIRGKYTLAHPNVFNVVVKDASDTITRRGAPVAATGTLTSDGTNVADADTVTIGSRTYTFKTALSTGPTVANEIKIGASAAVTLDNLKAAINGDPGAGALYSVNTLAHSQVSATTNTDTTQVVEAKTAGTGGNAIASTEVSTHLSWGGATLSGGYLADYTLDVGNGIITKVRDGNLVTGDIVSYDYLDPSKVTASDIIGEVDADGNRSGMQAFKDCMGMLGFKPKLLIAPGYSTISGVSVEMISMAGLMRAVSFIDAPVGTTFQEALEGRGPYGSIEFTTSSDRAVLCYPHVYAWDTVSNAEHLEPASQFFAGLQAAVDIEKGYWWSLSNQEIKEVTGMELPLSADITDPSTEVNALNEAGITTIYNAYATGFRSWGNRSAAWPTNTSPRNFVAIRRVADVIHESLELATLQFLDMPISDALIDAIRETGNAFIRTQIMRGALMPGSHVLWDPNDNPVTEIALGHLTFEIVMMPPPPLERVTYMSYLDINLLGSLTGNINQGA